MSFKESDSLSDPAAGARTGAFVWFADLDSAIQQVAVAIRILVRNLDPKPSSAFRAVQTLLLAFLRLSGPLAFLDTSVVTAEGFPVLLRRVEHHRIALVATGGHFF